MRLLNLLNLIILVNCLFLTGLSANETFPYQFRDVGITNKINTSITKPLTLNDDDGNKIELTSLLEEKPTIVNFVYLNCPMLCHLLLDGLVDVMKRSNYLINEDYQIITISIDPNEKTETLKSFRNKYLDLVSANGGWYFLKGNATEIKNLTDQMGYSYKYIKRTKDYAHPSVLYFFHPKQGITNYIEGVTFEENSFDYSIISLKSAKTLKERVITYCYFYDPDNQTYTLYIFNIMRVACLLTVGIIIIVIGRMIRKERLKK